MSANYVFASRVIPPVVVFIMVMMNCLPIVC